MKKILISGLGGSLFPYLHLCLSKKYEMFYVDADKTLCDLYPDYNFFHAPLINDDIYVTFIQKIIAEHSIDIYIPLIDEEIVKAHHIKKKNGNLILISPQFDFCTLTLNKLELMKYLEIQGISKVKSFQGDLFNWEISCPVFVKPIFGRGSRGIKVITTSEQLKAYFILENYLPKDILVQDYIEGQEYTVGVLTNNNNDILSISSKKVLKKRGITILAANETNHIIEKVIYDINNKLKPCGPYNVQLFLTNDEIVKIFEINPRFSTTTIMSYAGGVDEISMFVEYYNKKYDIPLIRPLNNIVLHRSWENVFYKKK